MRDREKKMTPTEWRHVIGCFKSPERFVLWKVLCGSADKNKEAAQKFT